MKALRAIIFCASSFCWAQAPNQVSVQLDPAHSTVQFTLGDVLHTVHGSFKVKSGSVQFRPDTGEASGEIVVDVTSGDTGGAARDKRMHKEILESARYPEATLTPDRVTGNFTDEGEFEAQIHGTLRIHGADHELTIPAKVKVAGPQLNATATFTMPYVKWGMKNPSTFLLRVSENVTLELNIAGRVTTK